jgi:hypothetical protein
MKKLINLLFFVGLITIFNASSCNKPDPEPELPTGENTAYYYLDGQLIIPKTFSPGWGSPYIDGITFYNTSNGFRIGFRISSIDLDLFIDNLLIQNGNYQLNSNSSYGKLSLQNDIWVYYYTTDNSGNLKITYLSDNQRQIKGTFEMDVYDSNGNVKHITDGHFNINLDTLND